MSIRFVLSLTLMMACGMSAVAQETPEAGAAEGAAELPPVWSGSGELSYVATSGNSDSTSLGLGGQLDGDHGVWAQKYRARFIRMESEGEETANSLEAAGRLERELRANLSAFGEVGYLQNRFAGIDDRYAGAAGLAWSVLRGPLHTLDTSAGLGYVHESRIDAADESFATAVAAAAYKYAFSERSHFTNQSNLELSLEEGDNWRGRNVAALVSGLTDIFALKLAIDVSYFNDPVPGFEKTDTVTSASIVAQF